jgi:hypothetical protein
MPEMTAPGRMFLGVVFDGEVGEVGEPADSPPPVCEDDPPLSLPVSAMATVAEPRNPPPPRNNVADTAHTLTAPRIRLMTSSLAPQFRRSPNTGRFPYDGLRQS